MRCGSSRLASVPAPYLWQSHCIPPSEAPSPVSAVSYDNVQRLPNTVSEDNEAPVFQATKYPNSVRGLRKVILKPSNILRHQGPDPLPSSQGRSRASFRSPAYEGRYLNRFLILAFSLHVISTQLETCTSHSLAWVKPQSGIISAGEGKSNLSDASRRHMLMADVLGQRSSYAVYSALRRPRQLSAFILFKRSRRYYSTYKLGSA